MNKEAKFLIKIVKQAAKLIDSNFIVNTKGDKGDLVTDLDYKVELFLTNKMKKYYPDFDIVSEEFNAGKKLSKNCFTIDPIDGTINFANNLPLWAIQVACIKDGETCASVIYAPKLNELYYADETGAYLNGKKIHVNSSNIQASLYVIECATEDKTGYIKKVVPYSIHARATYCSAINYAWVARGSLGAAVFMLKNLWDYVPGLYLVKQAGGAVIDKSNKHIGANTKEFAKLLDKIL